MTRCVFVPFPSPVPSSVYVDEEAVGQLGKQTGSFFTRAAPTLDPRLTDRLLPPSSKEGEEGTCRDLAIRSPRGSFEATSRTPWSRHGCSQRRNWQTRAPLKRKRGQRHPRSLSRQPTQSLSPGKPNSSFLTSSPLFFLASRSPLDSHYHHILFSLFPISFDPDGLPFPSSILVSIRMHCMSDLFFLFCPNETFSAVPSCRRAAHPFV